MGFSFFFFLTFDKYRNLSFICNFTYVELDESCTDYLLSFLYFCTDLYHNAYNIYREKVVVFVSSLESQQTGGVNKVNQFLFEIGYILPSFLTDNKYLAVLNFDILL